MTKIKNITLSKIAELSGTSLSAVSAILGNTRKTTARFSKKTEEKVLQVAKEYGFRPNRTARSLRSQHHDTIGIMVRDMGSIPHMGISWMLQKLAENGQLLTLEHINLNQQETPVFIKEKCVDGIVMFEDFGEEIKQGIERYDIPAIWINSNNRTSTNCILFDEKNAMDQAVSTFVNQGKENIIFLQRKSDHYSYQERKEGLKTAAQKHKVPFSKSVDIDFVNTEAAEQQIKQIVAATGFPCGFISDSSSYTVKLIETARESGLKIPEDLGITCIANHWINAYYPFVNTLLVETRILSNLIIDNLNKIIAGEELSGPILIKYELTSD